MTAIQHLLITALTAVICINAVTSSPLLGRAEESYRLNNPVTPVNYKIHLKTDFKEAKTEGEVNIILNTLEETNTLRIHAVDLEFKKEDVTLVLQTDPKQIIDITDIKPYEAGQFHELNLKTKLAKKSNYLLTIKFKGTLKEGSKGYYLLKFKSGKANKVMAVTFLSPIYARTVFPCFDEPELKATFDIKLTHDEDYDAYSNSKAIKSSKSLKATKMVTTEFAQTPIMSTYILAFALLPKGTFIDHEVKNDKKSSVSTNVLIRKDIKDQVEYLLPKTTSYLQALEKLTGVEYDKNLGKITHLTIPKSETGAMENWGLIIYGESGVVYDEANDPFSKTLAGQRVIAHELSHQWFGNLVTPKWWTDLWLKEGFASYMESVVMDAVVPGEFGTLKEYFAQIHHRYFKEDSSSNSRAMNTPVEKPEDIEKNFDVVQYEKGAQLLYMLEHIIGSELFKEGVQNYVKRNQRKSVTPDDLWEALQQIIDKNKEYPILGGKKVADIGNSWISKAGYPVVHVTFDADKKKLKFRQERFLTTNAKKAMPSPLPKSKWMVPINFITDKTKTKNIDTAPTHWLETQKLEVDYEDIKFVIANNEQTGYYRVNYDDSNWKAISDHLNTEEEPVVSTVTQAQLLDDAFTFAENGDLKYDVAIDLTRFLENVDEFLPWKPTSVYLMNIYDKISMTSTLEKYQKYLSKIAKKAFDKVLFNEKYEKNTDGILQEKLLPLMVRARSSEFVEKSEEIMNELKQKSSTVLKKFQRYIFCGAATTEFEYLMEQLNAKKSEHDKDDILFGLSCLSDIENINKALEEIEDKEDKFKFVKHVAELSPLIVYDNIENFKKAITDEKQVEEIMKILAARVGTEEQLEKLEKLNEEGKYDDLLELAKENHKWNNDNKDFHEWIEDNVDEDPSKPTPKPTTTPNPETTPDVTTEPPPDGALSVAVCLSMLVSTVIIAFLM